ncbi:HGGxSTG domain-containing protein [Bradyrhizobium sp. 197]|jgi:hypothetical protein|uniref:HGGxSTG domain-containing protein n=1 Tax=Bradyrhizobium sp. 197 TaxID=2782663 RepID=UPI0031F634F2
MSRSATRQLQLVRITLPMLARPLCSAKTRAGGSCRSPVVQSKRRCRMHGGARESGAPKGNRNALRHVPRFNAEVITERERIRDLLGDARELLRDEMILHSRMLPVTHNVATMPPPGGSYILRHCAGVTPM